MEFNILSQKLIGMSEIYTLLSLPSFFHATRVHDVYNEVILQLPVLIDHYATMKSILLCILPENHSLDALFKSLMRII